MELLKILTDDALNLTLVNQEVDFNNTNQMNLVSKLVRDMLYTMKVANGIGLAAPQVGVNLRVVTVDTTPMGGKNILIMINPKITEQSGTCEMTEGCLSFPNRAVKTQRAENITVIFNGFVGETIERKFSGIDAVCIAHEIDHLNNITFFDRSIVK